MLIRKRTKLSAKKVTTPLLLSPSKLSFAGTHKRTQNLDGDSSYLRPKMHQQISVQSTDSSFLPKEIQDSSFVDDVIDELNKKGIYHYDLIYPQEDSKSYKTEKESFIDKPLAIKDSLSIKNSSKNEQILKLVDKSKIACSRRKKNNESSRRSRASRKKATLLKEVEVARLEAENQRLSILLSDFNLIAASCKHWIVKKMDNTDV